MLLETIERLAPPQNSHVITFQTRGCGGLPAEPCILPAIYYRLIQVVDTGPGPLPLDVLARSAFGSSAIR